MIHAVKIECVGGVECDVDRRARKRQEARTIRTGSMPVLLHLRKGGVSTVWVQCLIHYSVYERFKAAEK